MGTEYEQQEMWPELKARFTLGREVEPSEVDEVYVVVVRRERGRQYEHVAHTGALSSAVGTARSMSLALDVVKPWIERVCGPF